MLITERLSILKGKKEEQEVRSIPKSGNNRKGKKTLEKGDRDFQRRDAMELRFTFQGQRSWSTFH